MALGVIALEIAHGQPDPHLIFGQTLHLGAIQVSYFDQIIPLGFKGLITVVGSCIEPGTATQLA